MPHTLSSISIFNIPHLRLGLPNDLVPLRYPHQSRVCTSPVPHTRPSHSSWFDDPNNIWWGVELVRNLVAHGDGKLKGKLANGVGSQYSHATSEHGLSSITKADAHTSAASSRLNWRPHRFKWTRPFRGKTKSGFCACAITFRTSYTHREGYLKE